jgi:hypothetical protein
MSKFARYNNIVPFANILTLPNICNPMTGYFEALERFTALLQRAEYCSVYENLLDENCTVACKT